MSKLKQKVFVGLSGGVDSSVSVALLIKAGFEVVGVFIKAWEPSGFKCTWREDRRDAMRVAAKLGIPFITLDFEKEYKEKIVDHMIADYRSGRTPNPDVMCNKEIKFGLFYDFAVRSGADYVATGHYARISNHQLLTANDRNKDQTYFLWNLKSAQLKHLKFPIGELQKDGVRKLAQKFGLPTATKKESQGLCFMGKLDIKDFLKQYLPIQPGEVLDLEGQKIGSHEGVHFYTLGERHGFKIDQRCPAERPYYIVSKNVETNQLVVSNEAYTPTSEHRVFVELENVNWIGGTPTPEVTYGARVRYRQPLQNCKIEIAADQVKINFEAPQKAIATGQSLVLYDNDTCLGGGVIR